MAYTLISVEAAIWRENSDDYPSLTWEGESDVNVFVSVATLKDKYSVGEQVELTDPPDEKVFDISITGNAVRDLGVESFERINFETGSFDNSGLITEYSAGSQEAEELKHDGYIVKLKEKPILEKKTELDKKAEKNEKYIEEHPVMSIITLQRFFSMKKKDVSNKIEKQKEKLQDEKEEFREKIDESKIKKEFDYVINAIAIDISYEEAKQLETLPEVEKVYPNYEVHATLMDSVPLIGADQVWEMDEDGNDCSVSGKDCLTGKNVTIAIIDTGIDYSHLDLGGSLGGMVERNFDQITESPMSFHTSEGGLIEYVGWLPNQLLKINNGNLLYFSDCNINIYNFETTNLEIIEPYDGFCSIIGTMNEDYIAYTANKGEFPDRTDKLFIYDRLNNDTIEVFNLTDSGLNKDLDIDGNFLVYSRYSGRDNANATLVLFNIIDRTETIIETGKWISGQFIEGDKLIYAVYIGPSVAETDTQYILYDINTHEKVEIHPPFKYALLDFRDNKIIYSIPFTDWRDYGIYNIETEEFERISVNDVGSGSSSINGLKEFEGRSTIPGGWIYSAYLEGESAFFSNTDSFMKVYMYDGLLNQSVQINLQKGAGDFDTEDEKMCFVAKDYHIYCHDYNSSYNYSDIPEPEFNEKVIGGYDFVNNDNDPMDDHGHGTHCAGTAAGNGALKGVAPDAKLYAYKVLDSVGRGYMSNVIAGIERATDPNQDGNFSDHVDVISMSLGASCTEFPPYVYDSSCGPDDLTSQAVNNAVENGVTVVIAAGNSGPSDVSIGSPGTAKNAITVGATDKMDDLADFSSRGPVLSYGGSFNKPDVVAPGVEICSAQWENAWGDRECLDNEHTSISGTSMATPHVAGLAALIKQRSPNLDAKQIKSIIKSSADDMGEYSSSYAGNGRVNALKAVSIDNPVIVELDSKGVVKGNIGITGTIQGQNLSNYVLRYKGLYDFDWTLLYQDSQEVINEVIFSLDSNTVDDGKYILSLVATDQELNEYEDQIIIKVLNSLGYETIFEGDYELSSNFIHYWSSPFVVGNIDLDDEKEIIVVRSSDSSSASIIALKQDGSIIDSWPKEIDFFASIIGYIGGVPILEDIDNDNLDEIILVSGTTFYAWNGDGSSVSGFPYVISGPDGKGIKRMLYSSIGDVDGDGNNEIISIGDDGGTVTVTDPDSGKIRGASGILYIIGSNGAIKVKKLIGGLFNSIPALADINNDGKEEIITTYIDCDDVFNHCGQSEGGVINVLDYNGDSLEGWPIILKCGDILKSPLVADLDNDNELEIVSVVHTNVSFPPEILNDELHQGIGWFSYVAIINKDGEIKKAVRLPFPGGWETGWDISLSDLNNDDFVEIIARAGNDLAIIRNDGSVIDYQNISSNSPAYSIVGDIDNDNEKEILIWERDDVKVLDEYLVEKQILTAESFGKIGGLILSDLNNNNLLDIVGVDSGGDVFVWRDIANYNQETLDCPMNMFNKEHTGCYGCKGEFIPRSQSKIVNDGNSDVVSNLIMKVQENNGGWIDYQTVFDGEVTVPANGLIKLDIGEDSLGNQVFPGWNNLDVVVDESNNYRVYVEFEGESASWEFEVVE